MFSLIITLVSIALVVALIAATMYYGSDTLSRGQAVANAAAIISGGEQVVAAIQTHYATTGRYPETLDELLTGNYLTSFPAVASAGFALVSSAHAAPVDGVGDWLYDRATPHLAYIGQMDMDTCAEVNNQVNGHRVVLNRIDPDPRAQCVAKGAQAPVVVFRHPGDKDFEGWDDHPRIPAPIPGGAFNRPEYAGVCVYGCEGTPGGPGNNEEPVPPEGEGGAEVLFSGPTLTDFFEGYAAAYGEPPSVTEPGLLPGVLPGEGLVLLSRGPVSLQAGGVLYAICRPVLETYIEYFNPLEPQSFFGSGTIMVNGVRQFDAYNLSDFSGITMSARLVKVREAAPNPWDDEYEPRTHFLAVFNHGNWQPVGSDVALSTFPAEIEEDSHLPVTSVGGVPYPAQINGGTYGTAQPGTIGVCAHSHNTGFTYNPTYRLDLTFSKNGESSSESLYYLSLGY